MGYDEVIARLAAEREVRKSQLIHRLQVMALLCPWSRLETEFFGVNAINTVFTETEMLTKGYIANGVFIARCVLRRKIAQLFPTPALVYLSVSSCLVAECVERRVVGVAHCCLSRVSVVVHTRNRIHYLPDEERRSSALHALDDTYILASRQPRRKSF